MKRRFIIALGIWSLCGRCALALDPALDIDQYAHTAWPIREGFFKGNIYSIAQTPDGYLWLGTEFGLLRFDGNGSISWQPPAGQHLPGTAISKLLGARDGTLWIGTDAGLVSWNGAGLTHYPQLDKQLVLALLEDHEGAIWAGALGSPAGRLCKIASGSMQCYGQDGTLGRMVSSLHEDSTGNIWVGTPSGLWRWGPASPRHYAMPETQLNDLTSGDGGELLIAMPGGIKQLVHEELESYPAQAVGKRVNANRLLRDRDGSIWIGTLDRGLIHIHSGRTDTFSRSDGLSGNLIFSLFEDREGNIWAATNGGLDRFREFPVSTISVKQGLSMDAAWSVLAATDGSIWIGSADGLNKLSNGQITTFPNVNGLPDDAPQSLYQDDHGRILAFAGHGLTYLKDAKFVQVSGVPGGQVHFITGDKAANLWLSENSNLLHLQEGHTAEQIPWSRLGHRESASVLLSDPIAGGLWAGFWRGGGVSYFKDGRLRASYTAANGLGANAVADLQLDHSGALWAATEGAGLSRVKDDRIATLTTTNGLPCNTVHWTIEADDHSFWLYTACGLVRIARSELDAWIADPKHKIAMTNWDALDGVRLRSTASSPYGPRVSKSPDGKIWFVTGEGVQVVDPLHLPFNKLLPPVHIERVTADHKIRWENLWSEASSNLRLPRLSRDLEIDYTALSLVAPEKIRFKYKLEGYDRDWQDAGNRRQAFYTNLSPINYRFRVMACNNSGVWNEGGASLDFFIAPAYYQTTWFRILCAAVFLSMIWAVYWVRVRALEERHCILNQHRGEIRALNERLMKAHEEERMRIAGELHDGVLQRITSFTIRLGTAMLTLAPDSEPKKRISGLQKDLIHLGTEIRQLSHELHPAVLQESGLPAALCSYCEEFSTVRGIPISCETDESVGDLSPGAALCLYRIAQEALGNVAKHSKAKQVEVQLSRSNGDVCLSVSDDGVGFSRDEKTGGLGLINMRERVHQLHGAFELESELGRGTRVRATVPFRAAS